MVRIPPFIEVVDAVATTLGKPLILRLHVLPLFDQEARPHPPLDSHSSFTDALSINLLSCLCHFPYHQHVLHNFELDCSRL